MDIIATKHNYSILIEDAYRIIKEQKERISKVKDAYISANKQFDIGDIIKITTPAHDWWSRNEKGTTPEKFRFAFVIGYEIDYKNDIKYLFKARKTDGSISKKNDFYGEKDVLTFYSNDY